MRSLGRIPDPIPLNPWPLQTTLERLDWLSFSKRPMEHLILVIFIYIHIYSYENGNTLNDRFQGQQLIL